VPNGAMRSDGIDFDEPGWTGLLGGYRVPYDPRAALRRLESGDAEPAWQELWNELHHQGDVGEASYAAVPHLVRIHAARGVPDWNTYAMVGTIEIARLNGHNPELPERHQAAYHAALQQLGIIGVEELKAAEDPTLVCCIIGVIAMGKGQRSLGRLALDFDEDERREILVIADRIL
jgi:hypothetical protein